MPSQIDSNINGTFPLPGADNDTQVFRDNFTTIKNSLATAATEITDLQDNTAKLNLANDFNLNTISNAVLDQIRGSKYPFDGTGTQTYVSGANIDWQQGSYQTWKLETDVLMGFDNLPGDPAYVNENVPVGIGYLRLELYGDGTPRTITFTTNNGTVIKKDLGVWDSTVTSTTNPVILDIWRHDVATVFIKYVGTFS